MSKPISSMNRSEARKEHRRSWIWTVVMAALTLYKYYLYPSQAMMSILLVLRAGGVVAFPVLIVMTRIHFGPWREAKREAQKRLADEDAARFDTPDELGLTPRQRMEIEYTGAVRTRYTNNST